MITQEEITTARLFLRSITPSVISELFETKSKEEIKQFFGVDDTGFEHYNQMHKEGVECFRHSMFAFLLIDKQTGLPIGECGFHSWNKTHRRAEIFYLIRNDREKKKGLMTEALAAVLEYGFNELGLHRVQALIDPDNTPSLKLLLRNGFIKEGTLREDYVVNGVNEDSDCYSLLKSEWKPLVSQF
jgi:ribosomal-protein-alanine N-acetyltransferase